MEQSHHVQQPKPGPLSSVRDTHRDGHRHRLAHRPKQHDSRMRVPGRQRREQNGRRQRLELPGQRHRLRNRRQRRRQRHPRLLLDGPHARHGQRRQQRPRHVLPPHTGNRHRARLLHRKQFHRANSIILDGTGNYSGGTFVNALHGQLRLRARNDRSHHSRGKRQHVRPLAHQLLDQRRLTNHRQFGISIDYGDGNTFIGGDWKVAIPCSTWWRRHNNTFVGVRNENSNGQVNAASGSAVQPMGDGRDHVHRQTHRRRYAQQLRGHLSPLMEQSERRHLALPGDATVTITSTPGSDWATCAGGMKNTDRRTRNPRQLPERMAWGPGDGTAGAQLWSQEDLLNNVQRFGVSELTAGGGNAQSFLNGAGTGSVCFQCSSNSGTGGVSIASGGATPTTVWNSDSSGNTYQLGRQDFYSASTLAWRWNCASTAHAPSSP